MDDITQLSKLKILTIRNLNISPQTIQILHKKGYNSVYDILVKLSRYEKIEGISDIEYKRIIACINKSVSCIHISKGNGTVDYIDNTECYNEYLNLIESAKLIKIKDLKIRLNNQKKRIFPFEELYFNNGIENLYDLLANENFLISLSAYENGEYIQKLVNKIHDYGYKFSFELKDEDVTSEEAEKDEKKKRKYFSKIKDLRDIDIRDIEFSKKLITLLDSQSLYNLFELLAVSKNKEKNLSPVPLENDFIFEMIENLIHQKGHIMFYEISSKSEVNQERYSLTNELDLFGLYCDSINFAEKMLLKDLHICHITNKNYNNQGIKTVKDLLMLSKNDFENMPTITKGQFEDIIKRTHEAGFLFRWEVDSKEQVEKMTENTTVFYKSQQEYYKKIESAKYISLNECGMTSKEVKILLEHGVSSLFDILAIEYKNEYESKVGKITTINDNLRIVNKAHVLGYKMFWEREPINPLITDINEEQLDRKQVLNSRKTSLVYSLKEIGELVSNKQKKIDEIQQQIDEVDSQKTKCYSYDDLIELNIRKDKLTRKLLDVISYTQKRGRLKDTINSEIDFTSKKDER